MYTEELPAQLKSQMKKPHSKEYDGETLMQNIKGNILDVLHQTQTIFFLRKKYSKKVVPLYGDVDDDDSDVDREEEEYDDGRLVFSGTE